MIERDREYWYESGYSVGYEKGFDTGYAEGCNDTNLENKPVLINLAITPPEPDAWYAVWAHGKWNFYEGIIISEIWITDREESRLKLNRIPIEVSNLWAVRLNLPEM